MSIQQHVLLRYRSEGHLRFDLPAALCAPEIGERLVASLRAMAGIYRVDLYARQGKLSIRYLDAVCGFAEVIRHFHALVKSLPAMSAATRTPAAATPQAPSAPIPGMAQWLRGKLEELRETATAMGIVLKRSLGAVGKRPRWLNEFLNDLLMLYLIKMHWHHILTLWLPNPWRYRYEWAATFYLIHLQVQSRLPRPA